MQGIGVAVWLAGGLPLGARAQTCHSPAGTWRLDMARSQLAAGLAFNPYDAVSGATLRIAVLPGGAMRQDWAFTGPHLAETDSYRFRIDGTRQPTQAVSVLYTVPTEVVPSWQNCTLLVRGFSHLFGIVLQLDTTYVLSADPARTAATGGNPAELPKPQPLDVGPSLNVTLHGLDASAAKVTLVPAVQQSFVDAYAAMGHPTSPAPAQYAALRHAAAALRHGLACIRTRIMV